MQALALRKVRQREVRKMKKLGHYTLVAGLFDYPTQDYPDRVRAIEKGLREDYPLVADKIIKFLELLPAENLRTMQELFTRSFDVQAITTLDIGYVLFGDDYKRGELLSNLNREHVAAKNFCGSELADHLPNVLRLLDRLNDKELIEELVQLLIAPSLRKMIGEFSPERIETKNKAYQKHYKTLLESPVGKKINAVTLYRYTLEALLDILAANFVLIEQKELPQTCDFLKSIKQENEIEEKAESHAN